VVVNHQQHLNTGLLEPRGDCPRADAVVRHQPHERWAVQPGERGHRRDLQQAGLGEDRAGREDLGRMEVADVRKCVGVVCGLACVRDRLLLAIGAMGVQSHQLDCLGITVLERQLRPSQHLSARLRGWTAERKAYVDAPQDAIGSTSRESLRPSLSV
jgi:hypothetical protein